MLPTQIAYGANKGKAYTEEEDRFIVCSIAKHGYGAWDELKADIRLHWRFRCVFVWGGGGGGGLGVLCAVWRGLGRKVVARVGAWHT